MDDAGPYLVWVPLCQRAKTWTASLSHLVTGDPLTRHPSPQLPDQQQEEPDRDIQHLTHPAQTSLPLTRPPTR